MLSPIACQVLANGKYQRTFHLRVYDRYGRESDSVVRKLQVITGSLVYTGAKPIRVSNKQAPTTISFPALQVDQLYMNRLMNITAVTGVYN